MKLTKHYLYAWAQSPPKLTWISCYRLNYKIRIKTFCLGFSTYKWLKQVHMYYFIALVPRMLCILDIPMVFRVCALTSFFIPTAFSWALLANCSSFEWHIALTKLLLKPCVNTRTDHGLETACVCVSFSCWPRSGAGHILKSISSS